MGELIFLNDRLHDLTRPTRSSRAAFFFDLACPFSYLAMERVERVLGEVDWVPTAAPPFAWGPGEDELRAEAERRAAALRLPLVWPDRFPSPCPRALRAAGHATEMGGGARFALAASRLAFCGGFDLEDPESLAEAAGAAGMHLDGCLAAAADPSRDARFHATAKGLLRRGVRRLPAVRIGRQWFNEEGSLGEAGALLRAGAVSDRGSLGGAWGLLRTGAVRHRPFVPAS
jgi:2-hydroxychromene-2-carboxylate isomerase